MQTQLTTKELEFLKYLEDSSFPLSNTKYENQSYMIRRLIDLGLVTIDKKHRNLKIVTK